MPITGPRTRVLNVRISKDEYVSLENAVKASGARSAADYCREKILDPRDKRMDAIHEQLKGLGQVMEMVLQKLEKMDEFFENGSAFDRRISSGCRECSNFICRHCGSSVKAGRGPLVSAP